MDFFFSQVFWPNNIFFSLIFLKCIGSPLVIDYWVMNSKVFNLFVKYVSFIVHEWILLILNAMILKSFFFKIVT